MIFLPFSPWGRRSAWINVRQALALISGIHLLIVSLAIAPSPVRAEPQPDRPLTNGIYFYGQSSQAGVIGQEYFIFQVQGDEVKGAFFLPQSEFYCASGKLLPHQLALSVRDPYGEDPPSAVNIALIPKTPVAGSPSANLELTLKGYQAIAPIGAAERAILAACL